MSIRSWSIRTLFPLMAVSILVSAVTTAAGAFLASNQATNARVAMNSRVSARTDIDAIAMLSERIPFNNVMRFSSPPRPRHHSRP